MKSYWIWNFGDWEIFHTNISNSRREQYDIRMGYVEFGDGNYAKAYGYFDRIGSRSEYVDHARYYKAYIDYAEGRYGRAKQGFETLARSESFAELGVEATQTMNDLWLSVKTSTANTTTYLILTLVAIAAVAAFFIISGIVKRRKKARRCRKWKQA